MLVQLRNIALPTFIDRIFAHARTGDAEPWYFASDVTFEVEPAQQLQHLTELFRTADALPGYGLSDAQIDMGLWCMLGGAHNWSFVSLFWDPSLPITLRSDTIGALFDLYDRLLAAPPYEAIDFRHPDYPPRRFQTIDYMALALVVEAIPPSRSTPYDRTRVRSALLNVLERLLNHPAPVTQYAALHGLGHLRTKKRIDVIDQYLARHPELEPARREYALDARAGTLL
jgi:hypothetical protein